MKSYQNFLINKTKGTKMNKLKELRESKFLTQRQVADKMGISESSYQQYEYQGDRIKVSKLKEITSILGVSVNKFFK